MTVGYFSPLPPARTGVADYAAQLLAELRRHGSVAVSPERCDVALYHMGNNQLHADVYRRALRLPGITLLHDAVLQHFYLGALSRDEYIGEFIHNYGEWSRDEAATLWEERSLSAQDPRYFARPMLRGLAQKSLATVVHNEEAAQRVREHASSARVVIIPHFYAEPADADEAAALLFRERIGAGPGTFLFGVFGYLRESKRIIPILRAFSRLAARCDRARLLVAGDYVSQDLERAAEPYLATPHVIRVPRLPGAELEVALSAVDCGINLRYPSAGETSGIAVRLMGRGRPVIGSGRTETAPPSFAVRPGASEESELLAYMSVLTASPALAREMGARAKEHIARYHSLSAAGARFWDLLCELSPSSSQSA